MITNPNVTPVAPIGRIKQPARPLAASRAGLLILFCCLVGLTGWAQSESGARAADPPAAKAADKAADKDARKAPLKPLTDMENPELIGKRNINKLQINFYNFDKEVAIGRQFSQEVDRSAKLVEDPIIVEYINKVGQNIVLHSDAKVPFTIKVIDADEINAFALPGGFFYVNKGLILAAETEAELAGPMAHEIAHVAARHGVEQASKGQIVNWGSLPLIFLGGWGGFAIRQAAGLAIPVGFLKFSRGAEYEADTLAVQYLWASGYDPNAMSSFFEKLQAQEGKKPGTMAKIFSTHPMVGDRIEKVNALIARFPERSEYTINTSEFTQVKNRLIAMTNARSTGGRGGIGGPAGEESKKPTLKRRQPTPPEGSEEAAGAATEESQAPDRPTLRRKETPPAEAPKPPEQNH